MPSGQSSRIPMKIPKGGVPNYDRNGVFEYGLTAGGGTHKHLPV
jgi:hypothetical protein